MIHADAGLNFWLNWVEHRGGLWEDTGDTAWVILPPALATELELPEATAVTTAPDVAREDGAMLLAAGHPALVRAAETVLAAGDTGTVTLAAPPSLPPDAQALLAKARECFPVDHGRIDPAPDTPPQRTWRPVLRLGALVGYEMSADEHYQEQVEVLVDVPSRLAVPPGITDRLARAGRDERAVTRLPDGLGAAAQYASTSRQELRTALTEAHRLAEATALRRQDLLAAQTREAYERERARAEEYYAAALDSLQRRSATAAPDRRELLQARADSTREERARRLAEIDEKHRARHTITPYRLHLLRVPALRLAVQVLRGHRRYPLTLDWLLPAGEFTALRCPACAEPEPQLVAAKSHLGCARCLPKKDPAPVLPPARTPSGPAATNPAPTAPDTARDTTARTAGAVTGGTGKRPDPAPATGSSPAKPRKPAAGRQPAGSGGHRVPASPAGPRSRGTDAKALQQRAFSFWDLAASANRGKLERLVAPHSPAAAWLRLYGPAGPLYGIGIGPHERVESCTCAVYPADPGATVPHAGGEVATRQGRHDYLLCWTADYPATVVEVLPYSSPMAARWATMTSRYRSGQTAPVTRAPQPQTKLDAVAQELWRQTLPRRGTVVAARTLAAWWRLPSSEALPERYPVAVLAGALERAVSYWAGLDGGYGDAARRWQVDEAELRKAGAHLQRMLHLSKTRLW